VFGRLRSAGVLPVVELPSPTLAVPLAETLRSAGLDAIEITFRADGAAQAIAAVRKAYPDVLVGAGTVLTLAQLQAAIEAGATFIVSPGFNQAIVERARAAHVVPLPGVCTPTEILMALEAGLTTLKFFPAEQAGGVPYLKALAGPFRNTLFVPTGGISAANLRDYLAVPSVLACGGSWLVKKELLAAGDFETVARLAADAVRVVKEVRGDAAG
jgi:2-dehydro-3-deoxyphosphogluconate aldolase/(4S)-4-hydroxy-2-oxoglutarate aldolase